MLLGYARCSKPTQNENLQTDALERAGCIRIFVEHASGFRADRPVLAELLDFARDGEDQIVVWRLDRLGRNMRHLLETVEELKRRRIALQSLTEQIDTTSPTGALVFHIVAALNQAERDVLRERTMAGLQAARARGRLGGRPRIMTEAKASMARALIREGKLTVAEVADEVGVAISTLYRALPGGREALSGS